MNAEDEQGERVVENPFAVTRLLHHLAEPAELAKRWGQPASVVTFNAEQLTAGTSWYSSS